MYRLNIQVHEKTKVCTDIYVQVEWYMNDERVEENISAGIIITDSSLVIQVRSVE